MNTSITLSLVLLLLPYEMEKSERIIMEKIKTLEPISVTLTTYTTSAKEIQKIEARHGLTYFVNYNKKTITLRTDMMPENKEFNVALDNWIVSNQLLDKVVKD